MLSLKSVVEGGANFRLMTSGEIMFSADDFFMFHPIMWEIDHFPMVNRWRMGGILVSTRTRVPNPQEEARELQPQPNYGPPKEESIWYPDRRKGNSLHSGGFFYFSGLPHILENWLSNADPGVWSYMLLEAN